MDVTTDRACGEIRREEPVFTLEGPASHPIPTSLLAKKTDNLSPTEATRSPPLAWIGFQDGLPDRPLADIARVTHNELLLPNTAGLPAPRTHELSVHTETSFQISKRANRRLARLTVCHGSSSTREPSVVQLVRRLLALWLAEGSEHWRTVDVQRFLRLRLDEIVERDVAIWLALWRLVPAVPIRISERCAPGIERTGSSLGR